ncbi:hypothetical protein [Nocardioides ochotonae]|uniref:hypothetical protein n=1 Tax=Nocardioides ochotonae TaxID=2685869 RepID=UPI00140C06E7|nr:hypothetical protein [Nocardioides ochotonae]
MSPENWGQLVTALLAATTVAAALSWTRTGRDVWTPAALLLLAAAGGVAATPTDVDTGARAATALLVVLGAASAVLGGGPVTARLFALVDRPRADGSTTTTQGAGSVLRGGTWIGVLERAAVFASLVAGWPEGIAVVLAVKAFGRYPELRAAEDGVRTGAAERFIIGTFASVLWAGACAAVVVLAR